MQREDAYPLDILIAARHARKQRKQNVRTNCRWSTKSLCRNSLSKRMMDASGDPADS
jgi:hypothetical protein